MSVIDRLSYGVKHILERDIPGDNLVVYPDDTFLVSYPESGGIWAQFLIANLLQFDPPVTLQDMERLVPGVGTKTRGFFKTMRRPRVIGDDGPFNPQYKNVIYVVRDPRDVAIAAHNSLLKGRTVDESYPIPRFVSEFVRGERCAAGSWGDSVASWLATRGNSSRFLLLRYEDLVSETQHELGRVARFLDVRVSADRLAEAARRGSADNMGQMGEMASVTAGRWQSALPETAVAEIESAWGLLMSKLGYELSVNA